MNGQKTEDRTIYLQMELKKGSFTHNAAGDFIFDVEASNENLDLEQQRVLQDALIHSKDYFLTNGVISKDHLHQQIVGEGENKRLLFNEEYVIGEPLQVYTEGGQTRVRGKLYKCNPHAQKFINLLKDGSTRVKASVGGIAPFVQKVQEKEQEVSQVVSFLWNDLALTIAPVNPTVSPAYMVKSLSSLEFVKALSAGDGTDSAQFTGGRAMIPEDIAKNANTVQIMEQLLRAFLDGRVTNVREAEHYLSGFGIDKQTARSAILSCLENEDIEEVIPMEKASIWDTLKSKLEKSLSNSIDDGNGSHPVQDDTELPNTEVPTLNNDPQYSEPDDQGDITLTDTLDPSPALEVMAVKIEELQSSMGTIAKALASLLDHAQKTEAQQDLFGKSMIEVMSQVEMFGNMPVARASAVTARENQLAKGGKGIASSSAVPSAIRHKQFTPETKNDAMEILLNAASSGSISAIELGKAETQINKSLRDPAFQIDAKYIELLHKSVAAQSV